MGKVDFRGQGSEEYGRRQQWWSSLKQAIGQSLGVKPSKVIGQDDWRTDIYREQLRRIVKAIIDVKVTNKMWDIDYFKEILLFNGKICVTDTETDLGILPLKCGVHGSNVFERANKVTIANHVLGNLERTIDFDCTLIYLMDNTVFWNFSWLVDIFANKLAMCDSSIDVNLLNSKVGFIVNAEDKKQADEIKMIYDKISSGEPMVVYAAGQNIGKQMELFNRDVKSSYIADAIQTEKRAILNEFMTYIGINNNNVEKRERLLFDEINGNNDEVLCNMKYIKECVEKCIDNTNTMFPGLNLKVDFPFYERLKLQAEMGQLKKAKTFNPFNEVENVKGGDSTDERD